MKSHFSSLILLFAFVNLVSSLEEDNSNPFRLVQTSGILYEKKASQDIMFVVQGKKVNPVVLFKQLVLREERQNEIYFTGLTCDNKEEIYDYSYIKCKIDLSKIQKGFYKIAVLFYDNENYINNNLPPLLILGNEKEDDELKLINVFSNITEYNIEQKIGLIFNKKIDYPYLVRNLFIYNNRSQHFKVPLLCNYGNGNDYNICECKGDFSKIGADIYFIERLEYNYNYTYPARNVTMEVHGQPMNDLKLLSVIGDLQERNTTFLNLTFNGNVIPSEFGGFYVYNQSRSYRLYEKSIRQYNRTSIEVEFDLINVRAGYYHMGIFYKGHDWRFNDIYVYVRENSYSPSWIIKNFMLKLIGSQDK